MFKQYTTSMVLKEMLKEMLMCLDWGCLTQIQNLKKMFDYMIIITSTFYNMQNSYIVESFRIID